MLTKSNLSHIMLIKINIKKKIKLTIPIALWVIDGTIGAFQDLIWMIDRVFPMCNKKILEWIGKQAEEGILLENISLELVFKLIDELIYEIRKHKKLKLIEVDTKDMHLVVEFC